MVSEVKQWPSLFARENIFNNANAALCEYAYMLSSLIMTSDGSAIEQSAMNNVETSPRGHRADADILFRPLSGSVLNNYHAVITESSRSVQ
jgi:hypothetical protein